MCIFDNFRPPYFVKELQILESCHHFHRQVKFETYSVVLSGVANLYPLTIKYKKLNSVV
jgi:hypothetical protein